MRERVRVRDRERQREKEREMEIDREEERGRERGNEMRQENDSFKKEGGGDSESAEATKESSCLSFFLISCGYFSYSFHQLLFLKRSNLRSWPAT